MGDTALSIDVLLAWGRDWQSQLEVGRPGSFAMETAVLMQYLAAANAALAEAAQRQTSATSAHGGRPRGGGMGAHAAALIAEGMPEDRALKQAARHHGKPVQNVRRALRRYEAENPLEFVDERPKTPSGFWPEQPKTPQYFFIA